MQKIRTLADLQEIFDDIKFAEEMAEFVYGTLDIVLDDEYFTPSGEDAYELYRKAYEAMSAYPSESSQEDAAEEAWRDFRRAQQ